jgi:hypothetical protein
MSIDYDLGWEGIETPQDVAEAVALIDRWKGDNEAAHGAEDDLYILVLRLIAEGRVADPSGVAAAALEARKIRYDRWYA